MFRTEEISLEGSWVAFKTTATFIFDSDVHWKGGDSIPGWMVMEGNT